MTEGGDNQKPMNHDLLQHCAARGPQWPSGTARRWLGWQAPDGVCSNPALFSVFLSKVVVCGLVTLPLAINGTLKWLSSLPILMQESFWW